MPESFDLNTPVGRRAVEVGAEMVRRATGDAEAVAEIHRAEARAVIAAALAVLTSDVCPVCGGTLRERRLATPFGTNSRVRVRCRNCDNGKVKPALVVPDA